MFAPRGSVGHLQSHGLFVLSAKVQSQGGNWGSHGCTFDESNRLLFRLTKLQWTNDWQYLKDLSNCCSRWLIQLGKSTIRKQHNERML